MKKIALFFFAFAFLTCTQSQPVSFIPHLVDDNFNGPAGIFVADIDNDGLDDIISAGADGNMVAWWKNEGGYPIEWTKQVIDNGFIGAIYVQAGDVDGDGLTDVLGAGWYGNQLAWWKNDGGTPIEWTKYIIRSNYFEAHEIMPCDIDKDGDMDVLGVSAALHAITLFENDGNWPITWSEHVIDNDFSGARSVDARDIDGDGDIDLAGAALLDHAIAWYRNDSNDSIHFTKITVGTGFTYSHKVQIVDIDKDGKQDILGTAYNKGLAWWENDGQDSVGWTKHFVSNVAKAVIGWAIDADLDNDMDVVCSAQTSSGKIGVWYNSGEFPFDWEFNMIENDLAESWPLYYGDLDNDGDIDLVCGGKAADEIRWYENDLITGLNDPIIVLKAANMMSCYPVPFKNEVAISLKIDHPQLVKIRIYDLTGQLLKEITNDFLPAGDYMFTWGGSDRNDQHVFFVRLEAAEVQEALKLIKGL